MELLQAVILLKSEEDADKKRKKTDESERVKGRQDRSSFQERACG